MSKIFITGIGPGNENQLTPQARKAILKSDVIVGYSLYINLISNLIEGKETVGTGMKQETQRAEEAFKLALKGQTVAVISSGDAGVYGMASLLWEMQAKQNQRIELEVIPGISAMFAAAALMGAPLGHDFCAISLSDLLTPWQTIEKRITAAASADFVTAVYNPASHDRYWQLMRLREIFLQYRSPQTPVGIAREVGRPGETVTITTLEALTIDMVDMLSMVIIGNSQSFSIDNKLITPRGYSLKYCISPSGNSTGRDIMHESFKTILSQLDTSNMPVDKLWLALHAIHTTADFNMPNLLEMSDNAVAITHQKLYSSQPPVIVTDVAMVTEGIRKNIVQKLGIEVKTYISHPDTIELAARKNITRAQAGMQLAVEKHPDAIFVFGNAPTALMELIRLVRLNKAQPSAIIASPVGFVNVEESKWRLKYGAAHIPHVIVQGRKGGSNLAATLVNAILTWHEAANMNPGEGL
jgi:precorrin-3B C17-methyltransferase